MDNTLLSSRIDFDRMKEEIYDFFCSKNIFDGQVEFCNHTVSTLLQKAKTSNDLTEETYKAVWSIIEKIEKEGMEDADLEPDVVETLEKLYPNYFLVILTNNSFEASISALNRNSIKNYFSEVVTRDHITELKPSPTGILYILRKYSELARNKWTMVGDSWIDGKAAADGGIDFIGYKIDAEDLKDKGIMTKYSIESLRELLQYV